MITLHSCTIITINLLKINNHSDTWGNVADWFIVFISLITAIFLVKSFKAQYSLNKLIFNQHLLSIMPIFKIQDDSDNSKSVILTNGHAKNIIIKSLLNTEKQDKFESFSKDKILPEKFMKTTSTSSYFGYITRFLDLGKINNDPLNEDIQIKLLEFYFEDINENLYNQQMYYHKGELYFGYPTKLKKKPRCLV